MSHGQPPRSDDAAASRGLAHGAGKRLTPEAALARKLLDGRCARDEALGTDLFGDVAWEMLLYLFVAHERGEHVRVAALPALIGATPGCAKRWLLVLEGKGLVVTIGEAASGDRTHVYLSGATARRLRALLRSWF